MYKTLVTSYINPDIDGVACILAYSEYLSCGYAVSAKPNREAQYVLERLKIKLEPSDFDDAKVILVDVSDTKSIDPRIEHSNVIEIIDHRKVHEVERFPNAIAQIELVGAAATLIAEKFINSGKEISETSAKLLYLAICSHTINFRNNVTTKRDIEAAAWLKGKVKLEDSFVKDIFNMKSKIEGDIKNAIDEDLALFSFNGVYFGIAQLEILDAEQFLEKNISKIKSALSSIKEENKLDFVFLSCIDLDDGFNLFVTIDEKTESMIKKIFAIGFSDGVARREGIIMRKEITPKVKDYLSRCS